MLDILNHNTKTMNAYYDREDVYMIITKLANVGLLTIPNATQLATKFDDNLNEWEEEKLDE